MIKINDIYATKSNANELYQVVHLDHQNVLFKIARNQRITNTEWLTRQTPQLVDIHGDQLHYVPNPPQIKPHLTIDEFNQKYQQTHLVAQIIKQTLSIDAIEPDQPEQKIIITRPLQHQYAPHVTEIGRTYIQDHQINFNELLTDVQYLA